MSKQAMSASPVAPAPELAWRRGIEFALLAGLLAGFVPVLWRLAQNEWAQPEAGHGPIILALTAWLLWRAWLPDFQAQREGALGRTLWVSMLVLAIVMYFVGTVGEISQLSYGALIPLLAAMVFAFQPRQRWRFFAFPILFLLFSIPLPGFIVDPITLPMKLLVSTITENVLALAGYPVSRSGVILYVGPYELLVADACAGLRTLFTLEALGLLYLNVTEHASALRNFGLATLIIPISIIANSIRVLVLCLVTYHLGDEAGQGFLHEFAGIALFLFGLILLLSADAGLRWAARKFDARKAVSA